jgi:phenylalanyl-tRNA synthetase beta chain
MYKEKLMLSRDFCVYGYNNISFSNKLNATVANAPRNEDYKLQNIIATWRFSEFNEMMANSLTTASYVKLYHA